MSNITDDELQALAEGGAPDTTGNLDVQAYKKLFSMLGEEPTFSPSGMEEAVIARIELSKKQSSRRDYLWLSLGVIVLLLTGIIAVALSDFRIIFTNWQRGIMALGICAGVVIMVLNTLERKLLHR